MHRRLFTLSLVAALATACSVDRSTRPTEGPDLSAVKFWESGSAVGWNERATVLTFAYQVDVSRLYAYLSLAQLRAAEAAEATPGPHPPASAAISGASVVVLKSFFPAEAANLEAALVTQLAGTPWPGSKHADVVAGEAIGRAVGAQVLAFAQGDRVGLTNPGTPPTGPGFWVYSGGPIARGNLGARPFFLTSGSQLRPPPPPEFNSPEYLTALAEVRAISDGPRTQTQLDIARYWNLNQSSRSNAAMNRLAGELIVAYRQKDPAAARTLFLMNAAAFDAGIGCFDAKYHYWYIRPPQADPLITTVFAMPPHPSYPSGHSCVSGAATGVLALVFPLEQARLEGIAQEASLSRLYAGIHYRFDMVAGLALGRAAARLAFDANLSQVATLP